MKKTTMKETINYFEDTEEDIREYEIDRLTVLLEQLKESDRLCDEIGRVVVLEFGFKGGLKEVKEQLHNVILSYKNKEQVNDIILSYRHDLVKFDSAMRRNLFYRSRRVAAEHIESANDPYYKEYNKLLKDNDLKGAMKMLQHIRKRNELMHSKKECLCYSNVIED